MIEIADVKYQIQQKQKILKQRIKEAAKQKMDLYISEINVDQEEAYFCMVFSDEEAYYAKEFYEKNGKKMEYYLPRVHLGRYLSSVLIGSNMLENPEKCIDFRYFLHKNYTIEFYVWHHYQGKVYIKNEGKQPIKVISTPVGSFLITPGEMILVSADERRFRIKSAERLLRYF